MFRIPIHNKATGEEKNFYGLDEVSAFLTGREDFADWTGWEFAGALPVMAPVVAKAEGKEPEAAPSADEIEAVIAENEAAAPSEPSPAVESDSTPAPFISQEPDTGDLG